MSQDTYPNSNDQSLEGEEVKFQDWDNPQLFREYCQYAHPATVADGLTDLEPERIAALLKEIDPEKRAELFGHLRVEAQQETAEFLNRGELAIILEYMLPDERADFFRALPEETQEGVLPLIARAEREDLRKLGSYEEGTAGSVMTSEYAAMPPTVTAQEAIEILRKEAPNKETIYNAYVIDSSRRLVGVVSLRELILAPPRRRVEDIMSKDVISANVKDSTEDVSRLFSKYDLFSLPITNGGDALVGIVTVDDVLDVNEEEATTDFHRLGSSGPIGMGIKEAPFWLLLQKRLPWLVFLVFMNVLSGAGIAYFEETIIAAVSLVFFLPLLIGSGGNAGSQSATLMVRALATGDVKAKDWFYLLGKEIGVALALGVGMAIAVFSLGVYRANHDVAVVVALSMIVIVLVGSLVGMSLPFIFTKLNIDAATASAPLVTSVADISGVVIYFALATWYLGL